VAVGKEKSQRILAQKQAGRGAAGQSTGGTRGKRGTLMSISESGSGLTKRKIEIPRTASKARAKRRTKGKEKERERGSESVRKGLSNLKRAAPNRLYRGCTKGARVVALAPADRPRAHTIHEEEEKSKEMKLDPQAETIL